MSWSPTMALEQYSKPELLVTSQGINNGNGQRKTGRSTSRTINPDTDTAEPYTGGMQRRGSEWSMEEAKRPATGKCRRALRVAAKQYEREYVNTAPAARERARSLGQAGGIFRELLGSREANGEEILAIDRRRNRHRVVIQVLHSQSTSAS